MKFNTIIVALTVAVSSQAWAAERFASPDAAGQAIYQAAKEQNTAALLHILGKEAKALIHSGDAAADQQYLSTFAARYDQKHYWHGSGDTRVLELGPDHWPFAIPLREVKGGWEFDTAAGYDELLLRRVGFNELSTIESMHAFVAAQKEYYSLNPLGTPQYAQRIASQPGKKDGLYWTSEQGKNTSPLGDRFAKAAMAGKSAPFNGYLYQVLKSQGADAEGGAKSYLKNGKMTEGFALLAYPAKYGDSGITSFIINQDGVVYEADLGPKTLAKAKAIQSFNPASDWKAIK